LIHNSAEIKHDEGGYIVVDPRKIFFSGEGHCFTNEEFDRLDKYYLGLKEDSINNNKFLFDDSQRETKTEKEKGKINDNLEESENSKKLREDQDKEDSQTSDNNISENPSGKAEVVREKKGSDQQLEDDLKQMLNQQGELLENLKEDKQKELLILLDNVCDKLGKCSEETKTLNLSLDKQKKLIQEDNQQALLVEITSLKNKLTDKLTEAEINQICQIYKEFILLGQQLSQSQEQQTEAKIVEQTFHST